MQILLYVVVVLHVLVCLFLIGVVLLQQGRSADLAGAFGGQGSQTAFGPRAAANVLTRLTTWSAVIFMFTSISSPSFIKGRQPVRTRCLKAPSPVRHRRLPKPANSQRAERSEATKGRHPACLLYFAWTTTPAFFAAFFELWLTNISFRYIF